MVTDVARSLAFAPAVRALAERVAAGIGAAGAGASAVRREFNAAHLRLEKDARDWSAIMGGEAVRPTSHNGATMHQADFGPVFLEGGLYSWKSHVMHLCLMKCCERGLSWAAGQCLLRLPVQECTWT